MFMWTVRTVLFWVVMALRSGGRNTLEGCRTEGLGWKMDHPKRRYTPKRVHGVKTQRITISTKFSSTNNIIWNLRNDRRIGGSGTEAWVGKKCLQKSGGKIWRKESAWYTRLEDNIKMNFNHVVRGRRLDSISGQRSVVGFCEQGNEPGESVNWLGWGVFLRQLSNNTTMLLIFTCIPCVLILSKFFNSPNGAQVKF